jgi:hypothetical protein
MPAPSATASTSDAVAAKAKHGPARLGGHVKRAWPAPGAKGRPKTPLTRWLARQVGPRTPIACKKRPSAARKHCGSHRGKASAAALAPAMASAVANRLSTGERINVADDTGEGRLALIRSFDIPADDPSYDRLLNWSWTYDSAVAATAFSSVGLTTQSERLLDQLAALQRKNGSIEFAFDVSTGESSKQIRSGAVAFAAIAFANYGQQYSDTRYLDNARRAVDYLLSLRNDTGLVRGGPDVKWVSTQHNLLTYIALTILTQSLEGQGDQEAADAYRAAADGIAKGIDNYLIVRDGGLVHFRQGVNDEVVPVDTQALGILFAAFTKNEDLAMQTYKFAQENFLIGDRSIKLSKQPATYNMTYEAPGPFTGYRPYLGKKAPDVMWFEGTAEMRFITQALGDPTDALDQSMDDWWSVTRKQGLAPLGADRTVTKSPYNEYHVWPTAAAGAWTVLSGASSDGSWADPDQQVQQVLQLLR